MISLVFNLYAVATACSVSALSPARQTNSNTVASVRPSLVLVSNPYVQLPIHMIGSSGNTAMCALRVFSYILAFIFPHAGIKVTDWWLV